MPFVIGLCSRRVLAAALCRNSQSCLAGPSKPSENKIAAVGSKKRLPWSHNDILRLMEGLRSCPLAYCPPGRVSSVGLSWHTSSVGVPGYSGYCPPGSRVLCVTSCPLAYCPPGSRVLCVASCPVRIVLEDFHMQGKTVYSCLSPWRGW